MFIEQTKPNWNLIDHHNKGTRSFSNGIYW